MQAEIEAMARQMEADREARVAHLQQLAARRLGQQGLLRGWGMWLAQHEERKAQRQALKQAGARLLRPKLTASFGAWRADWDEGVKAAVASAHSEELSSEARRSQALEEELRVSRRELAVAKEMLEQIRNSGTVAMLLRAVVVGDANGGVGRCC